MGNFDSFVDFASFARKPRQKVFRQHLEQPRGCRPARSDLLVKFKVLCSETHGTSAMDKDIEMDIMSPGEIAYKIEVGVFKPLRGFTSVLIILLFLDLTGGPAALVSRKRFDLPDWCCVARIRLL